MKSHSGSCQWLKLAMELSQEVLLVGRRFNALRNVRCNSSKCHGNKKKLPLTFIFVIIPSSLFQNHTDPFFTTRLVMVSVPVLAGSSQSSA